MKQILFIVALLLGLHPGIAQQPSGDSCSLQISLITCGPGQELYSLFGHTALRVSDRSKGFDIVYNYGTFDFEDPAFYAKFTKGKLLYFVSTEKFSEFLYQYQYENRYVVEQVLNLNCTEKHQLFSALQMNSKEENRYYRYDFVFDNCSTRPRNMIVENTETPISFRPILSEPAPSFRNLLHEYLQKGHHPWSQFGIDLILGSKIDRRISSREAMFLPDYLMKGMDSAYVGDQALVGVKRTILQERPLDNQPSLFTPMVVFWGLFIVIAVLSFARVRAAQQFLKFFDPVFFSLLALIGCFLLFMWFGTEHELCRSNYNLFWALPIYFVALGRNKQFFKVVWIYCAVLAFCWWLIPQGLNPACYPLLLTAGLRSYFNSKK